MKNSECAFIDVPTCEKKKRAKERRSFFTAKKETVLIKLLPTGPLITKSVILKTNTIALNRFRCVKPVLIGFVCVKKRPENGHNFF